MPRRGLTTDPHTLGEVLATIGELGRRTGREDGAAALVAALTSRLDAVRERVAGRARPRVLVLEWTDPPYAPGHWMPEMVEAAGGTCVLGTAGQRVGAHHLGRRARGRPGRRPRRALRLRPRRLPR